jgi:hypothetical protein
MSYFGFKTEKQLATEKEPRITRITNEILGPITEHFFEIKKKYHDELTQWRQDPDPDPLLDPMVSLKQYSDELMNLLSKSLIDEFKKFYIAVCTMKGNRINDLAGVIDYLQKNPTFLESYKNQLIIHVVNVFEMQFGSEADLDKMFKIPDMFEHMVHHTFGPLSLYFIIKTNHPEHVIYILADIIWFIRNGSYYDFRSISLDGSAVSDFFKSNPLYEKEHMHVGCIDAMQIAAPHLPRVSIKKTHKNFEEIFMGGHDKNKHNDVRRIQRFIALNHLLSFFETGTTCKNVVYTLSNIFVKHMFPHGVVPRTDHGDLPRDSRRERSRSRGGRKIKTVRRHKTNKHNKSKSRRG